MRGSQAAWMLISLVAVVAPCKTFAFAFPDKTQALMDPTVSPCDDFYQYACGGWIQATPQPADKPHFSYAMSQMEDSNREALLRIYRQGKPLVTDLFQSCMDLDEINAIGSTPVQETLARIATVKTKGELFALAAELWAPGLSFLIDLVVYPDMLNATFNVLEVDPKRPTLGDTTMYTDADTWTMFEPPYRQYIAKILTLNGVATATAEAKVNVVIQLEHELATRLEVASAQSNQSDADPLAYYHPIEFQQAVHEYPLVIGSFVAQTLKNILPKPPLAPHDHLVATSLVTLQAVEQFVADAKLSSLQTLLEFQFLDQAAKYMGDPLLEARFNLFDKLMNGQKKPTPRDKVCARIVQQLLPDLVGKYFFEAKSSDFNEQLAQTMIDAIETAMQHHLQSAPWLDEPTRSHALAKLQLVSNLIGHSKSVEAIDPALLHPKRFFANVGAIYRWRRLHKLALIGQPVDRSVWYMSGAVVNAMYNSGGNQMSFPAGVLQPPWFDAANAPAQNFGAIGVVMGHEVTHGFDDSGRRFDGRGNLKNWWTEQTNAQFEQRKQCLVDQYSAFQVTSDANASVVLGHVNGHNTIGENIADNGGFGVAFDAFHAFQSSNALSNSTEDLDRLFYVSYAQSRCSKDTDGYKRLLLSDEHSPDRFRVLGVIQNDVSFGQLFHCTNGTAMNPTNKCKVW